MTFFLMIRKRKTAGVEAVALLMFFLVKAPALSMLFLVNAPALLEAEMIAVVPFFKPERHAWMTRDATGVAAVMAAPQTRAQNRAQILAMMAVIRPRMVQKQYAGTQMSAAKAIMMMMMMIVVVVM